MHEKHQASAQPHWDSLLCNTWHYKYTLNHHNTRKNKTWHKHRLNQLSVEKGGRLGERPPRWRADTPRWMGSCVRGSCLCAASPPRPQPAAQAGTSTAEGPSFSPVWAQGTYHALQAIPTEPVQELESVTLLCNTMTWVGAKCATSVGYLNVLLQRVLPWDTFHYTYEYFQSVWTATFTLSTLIRWSTLPAIIS